MANVVTSYSTDNFGTTITWDALTFNGDIGDKSAFYIKEYEGAT